MKDVLARARPRQRQVRTPEGVALGFELAARGERLAAFAVDALLVVAACTALAVGTLIAGVLAGPTALALGLLAWFGLRCFYFTWFEARSGGATPGKRALGLRVIDRNGGPLTGGAVVARNLLREAELFLPLTALLAPEALLPDLPGWTRVLGLAWVAAVGAVPLLSRDGLRAGDLVAGTLVVRAPRVLLLDDLGAGTSGRAPLAFTPEQLDQYGIYELQVLEKLLRQASTPARDDAMRAVAGQIRQRIGWRGPAGDPEAFLTAFYQAQRARLEQRMLLGERRERKRAAPAPPPR